MLLLNKLYHINLKSIQDLKISVCYVQSNVKIYLTHIRQILKTSTISYIQFRIHVHSVCKAQFPSFKICVIILAHILFHLKRYVRAVMDLCPATFRSFVVQWSTKIAGLRPQLKPLLYYTILY